MQTSITLPDELRLHSPAKNAQTDVIQHAYAWKRDLFKDVAASLVTGFIPGKEYLNPHNGLPSMRKF